MQLLKSAVDFGVKQNRIGECMENKLKNVKEWENALLNRSYLIMSVDRTENSASVNKTLENDFRALLKKDKVEFYEIDGVYDEPDVTERSFLIFTTDYQKMLAYKTSAGTIFKQESVLVHLPLWDGYDRAILFYLNYEKKGTNEDLKGLTVRTFKFQKTYISKVIGQNIYFAFGVDLKRRVMKRA